MHDGPKTAKELVDRLGGLQIVGKLLDVSAQAVWNAQDRGCFAPRHWKALVEAAANAETPISGVTLEWLAELSEAAGKAPEAVQQGAAA